MNHEDEGPLVKSYNKNVAELVTEMRAERKYPKLRRQASEEGTARKSSHQMWNGQRDGGHSQEKGKRRKGNSSQPIKRNNMN